VNTSFSHLWPKIVMSIIGCLLINICSASWVHAACPVTRSRAVLLAFVKMNPCPSTGKRETHCPGFVLDHIEPLCLIGKAGDVVENLQWQRYRPDSLEKDKEERAWCRMLGTRQCQVDAERYYVIMGKDK
jgi:hypothetical protein